MDAKRNRIVVAFFLLVSFWVTGGAFANVTDLNRQADKIIRNAERMMHKGQNAEADALLGEAAALIDQMKTEDPGNKIIIRIEKKFGRIQKNVQKKLAATQPKTTSQTSSSTSKTAKKSGGDKLPGGVKKRIKDITRYLDSAEGYVSQDAKNAKYKLRQAEQLFKEIEKNYSSKFSPTHPDFVAVKNRFNTLSDQATMQSGTESQAKADAGAAKAAQEKQSAEWVAKFNEYLAYPGQEGNDPEKLVFVPGTSEPEKFTDAQKRYENFKSFYEEYKKTDFPNGKTWELEDLADKKAPSRLKDFVEGFSSRVDSVSQNAENEIITAMSQLNKDNGWKSDKSIKPNLIDHKWMASIQAASQKVMDALGANDPKRKNIQIQYDALVAQDQANRQIRKERTFMTPDRYTGNDIGQLKDKAESLVMNNKKEGGTPLRCTIISEKWQEQTVEEWTDTSKTTWRIRTTRSLSGQVAARTSNGVRLITVALAKDKQSNGKWGALYGNLHQYSDPMLESNVDK